MLNHPLVAYHHPLAANKSLASCLQSHFCYNRMLTEVLVSTRNSMPSVQSVTCSSLPVWKAGEVELTISRLVRFPTIGTMVCTGGRCSRTWYGTSIEDHDVLKVKPCSLVVFVEHIQVSLHGRGS